MSMRASVLAVASAALLFCSAASAQPYTPTCGVPVERFDDRGDRFALLVSVNEYAPGSSRSDLSGAGNDMERLCRVLVDRYGFDEADVLRLHGPGASHDGILEGLDALAERSRTGRVMVFGYAGHGSYAPDDQADEEPDGRDETICPWDAETAGDLRDDRLHGALTEVLAGGGHVVTIFDSCHSGTATRGDPASPAAGSDVVIRAARPVRAGAPSGTGALDGSLIIGSLATSDRVVWVGSADDRQEAKELAVELDDGTVVRHGAFSHALLSVLETVRPGAPWEEILDAARAGVPRQGGRQTPQFAGNLRLQAFGTAEVTADPHFVVAGVESGGEVIKVKANAQHGIEPGAVLSVYGRGTKRLRGAEGLVGLFEVTWVGGSSLRATRQPDPADAAGGAKPRVRRGCPVALLVPGRAFAQRRVFLDPATLPADWIATMRTELALLPLVEAAPEGAEPGPDDLLVYRESAARGCVVVEGGPTPWPAPAADAARGCAMQEYDWDLDDVGQVPQEPRHVLDALGTFAAWERIRAIGNHDPEFDGDRLLEVTLERRTGGGRVAVAPRTPDPESGGPTFQLDDQMVVRYRNQRDEGHLFVTALYLSNDGAILSLNPKQTGGLLPGREVVLEDAWIRMGAPCGTDYVKLFVTERRAFDPLPFLQGAPALPATRGSDDLDWWIEPLLLGTRSGRMGSRSGQGARWATIDLPLRIVGCTDE